MMGLSRQRTGQIGVNVVERIVLHQWGCRWQAIDAHNDDGVDGLIFFESGGDMTGEVMFAQVKCLNGSPNARGDYSVPIGGPRLPRLLSLWRRVVGGAILILVDPKSLQARWVDVRRGIDHGATRIIVPGSQHFDLSAKHQLRRLCGSLSSDLEALRVDTVAADFGHLVSREHVQTASRALYRNLASRGLKLGDHGPAVGFDRDGWHHITRRKRKSLARFQSFTLLGCVPKILEASAESDFRPWGPVAERGKRLVSLDAMVTFPFRQTGLVRLVLERLPYNAGYRFYTSYEPRRKSDAMGVREPRRL